jgi:hypothetical protein
MHLEKPTIGKRTGIGKAFDELVLELLPYHKWEQEQKEKRNKIKL